MAATNETSDVARNKGWYQEDLTEINEPNAKPTGERERGFASNPYPCIGLYRFTILTLHTHPLYEKIVERLKAPGATYLDVGCCFGQELRQLVLDGLPPENLIGIDIAGALIEHGYELFLDRQLESRFGVIDVFKGPDQPMWAEIEERGVDVLYCSAFFHLFPLQDQVAAAKLIARLVKKDGVLVGRQIGSTEPSDVAAIQVGSSSYRHNVETLDSMWREVSEGTGTEWKVEGTLDMVGIDITSPVEDKNSRRLLFTVTRLK
ncbi:hypothetical protein LQW54_001970 [Pestalotiopsis sp. IQ-011]